MSDWRSSKAFPVFPKSFSEFLFGFDLLQLLGWMKRRWRLYLEPQLLQQISLYGARTPYVSHWFNFEEMSGPKLLTNLKETVVLQMGNRLKEGHDLAESWGLLIVLLYPTPTPDNNPNSECREYLMQDHPGEALGSVSPSCFQLHYSGLCYHVKWQQGSGKLLKASIFLCVPLT